MCNFGRGHYGEHSCEIILNLDQWLMRKCLLKKKFRDNADCTADKGQRPITIAHIEPSASSLRHLESSLYYAGFPQEFKNTIP